MSRQVDNAVSLYADSNTFKQMCSALMPHYFVAFIPFNSVVCLCCRASSNQPPCYV